MLKTLTSLAIVLAAGAAQAQGYNYGSRFDNAPGLTGAPGLYAPGLGQRFDQDQYGSQPSYDPAPSYGQTRDSYNWHHGYDRGGYGDDGYHPRDSYDWHHGYDNGDE
jgi:hypothetical protein